VRFRFKKALEAAGIREIKFHDLRHTYGTLMASGGVPMKLLQEWMGHESLKTTEKYAKWAPKDADRDYAERAVSDFSMPATHATPVESLLAAAERP